MFCKRLKNRISDTHANFNDCWTCPIMAIPNEKWDGLPIVCMMKILGL